jgi:hypothetical protein
LTGLLLIAAAAMVFYGFVTGLRDKWVAGDRGALQLGAGAGKSLRDADCVEQALVRLRDGRAGDVGIYSRPWIKGCLRSATPTVEFCRDAPPRADREATLRWQGALCEKHHFPALSTCGAVADEAQTHCGTRATAP